MLRNNPMRFGSDDFIFSRQGLLVAKMPFDTTDQTSVTGFNISGAQPVGTARRIIFRIGDDLYKFVDGNLTAYDGAGEFDDVIAGGNTVDELLALTDIPAFVGKKIYPIIALEAPADAVALPTIKMSLNAAAGTDIYNKPVETPVYELAAADDGTPRIADIVADIAATGTATCTVEVRIRDSSGSWSDYVPLAEAKNQEGTAVQFRITYAVRTLDGSDAVKLNSITIRHNMGATSVSGDTADLYSVVQSYENDLQTCYVVVKHKRLIDSKIIAYVNFMRPTARREFIDLGVSDGTRQQFNLGVGGVKDTGIDQNTLRLFADGVPTTNYGYNVEVSEVTISVEAGKAITASYDYGHDVEEWIEMPQVLDSQPYQDGTYMSKFMYTLPDETTADKKLSNVRLRLYRPSGRVDRELLGYATGTMQQFVLPHAAKQDSIILDGAEFSYDPDSQILTAVAPKGTELVVTYDYVGEQQTIYSWTAGWAVAV